MSSVQTGQWMKNEGNFGIRTIKQVYVKTKLEVKVNHA